MSSREHIIQEAKKLFRHKGYVAVSMTDIVNACGVTKPTIYHFFGDKEGLYTETLIDMLGKGATYIAPTIESDIGFSAKLQALAIGYFENTPTSVASLIRDSSVHLGPSNQTRVNEAMHEKMYVPFEHLFKKAIQNQELSPDSDPIELSLLFVTFMDTYTALHRARFKSTASNKDIAQSIVKKFIKGLE